MSQPPSPALHRLVRAVLRPLVRLLIARGVGWPALAELIKGVYVEVAEQEYALPDKRLTDSRLSLLTGLQRRDVKAIRSAPTDREPPPGQGPVARVFGQWLATEPAMLARDRFEALVAGVSRDVHPRTVLDELVRLGLVDWDRTAETVTRRAESFLPAADDARLLSYAAASLEDHGAAVVANLLAAPTPGPYFERSVHYNRLSEAAVARLTRRARDLQAAALETLNAQAAAEQARCLDDPEARHRFRAGAYIFHREQEPPS